MTLHKNNFQPSVNGQDSLYLYSIFRNINKFKVLLVFLNKNFTWHRELSSLGIFSKDIEDTLNEFNNMGLVEIKELTDLDNIQYEVLKTTKQDMQHYFKIYFITQKCYDLIAKHQEDCYNVINDNTHLLDFIEKVKQKLIPFKIQLQKIMSEETSQYSRKVTLDGITFEKSTLMSKEVKKILQLTQTKKGTALVLNEIKPLALMTETEKKRHLNKVYHNGKEVNSSIFREQEEYDRQAEEDFKTGNVGKSLTEIEIEAENRQKGILNLLGIEDD